MPNPTTPTSNNQNYSAPAGNYVPALIDTSVTPPSGTAGQVSVGDMLYSTGAGKVASLTAAGTLQANLAQFVGVAKDCYPLAFAQYATESLPTPNVVYYPTGYFRFYCVSGAVYTALAEVTWSTDPQTVAPVPLPAAPTVADHGS